MSETQAATVSPERKAHGFDLFRSRVNGPNVRSRHELAASRPFRFGGDRRASAAAAAAEAKDDGGMGLKREEGRSGPRPTGSEILAVFHLAW